MSTRNPWEPEPHRFVVEELLDLFPVVRSPNNHAPPAGPGRSAPSDFGKEAERKAEELANERTTTTTKCTSYTT
jgi:hypothetical protein